MGFKMIPSAHASKLRYAVWEDEAGVCIFKTAEVLTNTGINLRMTGKFLVGPKVPPGTVTRNISNTDVFSDKQEAKGHALFLVNKRYKEKVEALLKGKEYAETLIMNVR